MAYSKEDGLTLLRLATDNPSASFLSGQEQGLRHIVQYGTRLLLVEPPGWGKTLTALLATKLLRQQGHGPALIVTPEVTHVHRDIALAERLNLQTAVWTSENDWHTVGAAWRTGQVDVLIVNAVRPLLTNLLERLLAPPAPSLGLLILEHVQALCVSSHVFQPAYRSIQQAFHLLGNSTRLFLTAPALASTQLEELHGIFGKDLVTQRSHYPRVLTLQTIHLTSQAERYAWLARHVPHLEGPGIIYTATKRDAYQVTEWLNSRGVPARSHTASQGAQRARLEQAFLQGRANLLVTPFAYGVGVHHPELRFVIHYDPPPSLTDYYRQLGQAGIHRPARALIMRGHFDENQDENEAQVPTAREVQQILTVLRTAPQGLTPNRLAATINAPLSRLRYALQLLALESPAPVIKVDGRWRLVSDSLPTSWVIRLNRLRTAEQERVEQVRRYLELADGHWDFLLQTVGVIAGEGTSVEDADGVPHPEPLPIDIDSELVAQARSFLRRGSIIIEPRKQWPPGGLPRYRVRGRMPHIHWARQGKALCIRGDSGWGELVAEGKRTGRFADELVDACVHLYYAWRPIPPPQWVTCIPSRRHPHLVPDFAARLARALNLPFRPVLAQVVDRPPQHTMANSTRHALNVDGTLRLTERPPQSPVLLVDDIVDSRWTFTIAAWLLRQSGVSAVFPLALASHYGMPESLSSVARPAAAGESH